MIDQAGAPSVLFGIPPDGNTSGYLLNQLINTARVSFQQIARHAEQALERIVQLMWRLVETRIGEPVFVFEAEDDQGWIGLGPQDIDGYHAVRVRLDPLGPADDVAQGTLAANLVSARLASRRWAMREKLGIEDAEAVEDEILLDELIDAPEVRAAIVREALGQAGSQSQGTERRPMPRPEQPRPPDATRARVQQLIEQLARRIQARRIAGVGAPGTPDLSGPTARGREPHPTHQSPWPGAIRAVHPAASARRRRLQAAATTKGTRMTLPQPASAKTFAERLTSLADVHLEQLCQTVLDRALTGERWAMDLVIRYAYERDTAGRNDALLDLLQELRTRTAPSP